MTVKGLSNGTNYRWAFYRADAEALHQIKTLVEQNQVCRFMSKRVNDLFLAS
jgi:hypothetical protein